MALVSVQAQTVNVTCQTAVFTDTTFCQSYVNYPIASNLNTSEEDSAAYLASKASGCPYYTTPEYQCRKRFPRCDALTAPPTIYKVCRETCYYARKWEDGFCSRLGVAYFQAECDHDDFYSSGPCDQGNMGSSNDTWKWVLVGCLGGLGVILLASWVRTKCRERMSMEELEKEDEERARKQRAKQANEYQDIQSSDAAPARGRRASLEMNAI